MKFEDLYYEEFTTATYRELHRVGAWFNQIFGYHPVLVGDWAVFHYNPAGLGSRDIDLIFPDCRIKDRAVNQYMLMHGYERERQRLFQPTVTSASPEDFCHFHLAPLDHVNDTKVTDPQPVERLAMVPPAVLDVGPGPCAEWVCLEFPQVVQDSIALTSLLRPQERQRFVGEKDLKFR